MLLKAELSFAALTLPLHCLFRQYAHHVLYNAFKEDRKPVVTQALLDLTDKNRAALPPALDGASAGPCGGGAGVKEGRT